MQAYIVLSEVSHVCHLQVPRIERVRDTMVKSVAEGCGRPT